MDTWDLEEAYVRPTSKRNYISVEIECFTESYDEIESFKKALIKEDLGYYCSVKDDGSIEPDGDDGFAGAMELVVCAPQDEIKDIIKDIGVLLKKYKFRTNHSCGLHVHLDMRNRKVNTAFKRLYKKQDLIFSVIDPSRKHSEYCEPIKSLKDKFGRKAINFEAYKKHKTLEIRAHEGTVNPVEISNYIDMLVKIADGKKFTALTNKYIKLRQDFFKLKEKVA